MTIRLWDALEELNFLVGADFPEADEDALWRCAQAWAGAATDLRRLEPDAVDAGVRVVQALDGEAADAFANLWRLFTGDGEGLVEQLAAACDQLAAACDRTALEVEYAKIQYVAALVILGVTIASLLAMVWAAGVSAGGIPIAIAAAHITIRLVLVRLLSAIAFGTALNVAVDGLAQVIQFSRGSRDDWDWVKTRRAAEDGAIFGAVGGGVFLAGGRLAPGLMSTPQGLLGASGVTGALGGVAAPLAHGEPPRGRDFLLAVSSGIVGALGPDLARGRVPTPDLSRLTALDPAALDPAALDPAGWDLGSLSDVFFRSDETPPLDTGSPDVARPQHLSTLDDGVHRGDGSSMLDIDSVSGRDGDPGRPTNDGGYLAGRAAPVVDPISGRNRHEPAAVNHLDVPATVDRVAAPGARMEALLAPFAAPGHQPGLSPAVSPHPSPSTPAGSPSPAASATTTHGAATHGAATSTGGSAVPPTVLGSGPLDGVRPDGTGPLSGVPDWAAGTPDAGSAEAREFADTWELSDEQAVDLVRTNVFATDAGLAFYALDDEIRDFARAVFPTEGYVTLDLHGSPKGFQIHDYMISPEQFAGALRVLRDSGVLELPTGVGIKLLSCDTAVGGANSPAARLARELGVDIVAPDQPVWTTLDGEEVVASPVLLGGSFMPADPPDGNWHLFTATGAESTLDVDLPVRDDHDDPPTGERRHGAIPRGPNDALDFTSPVTLDPGDLVGRDPGEIMAAIPINWAQTPSRNGGGVVFRDPDNLGRQVRIMPGYTAGNRADPLTHGPYVEVSQNGTTVKIPLRGNPTLADS